LGDGGLELRTDLRQAIKIRSIDLAIAITVETICPERVYRDDD
jgi:hypothetical protein